MFTQMFSGLTHVWLEVALLVCLLGTLIFRPDRIHRIGVFRRACFLFAISIIMPSIAAFFMPALDMENMMAGGPMKLSQAIELIRVLAFSGSFVLAAYSLLPLSQQDQP